MKRKTDRRTLYTKRVIKESLVSFMREKPFPRITVKEVCERAEIHKGTFYLHYQNLQAVLEELEDDAVGMAIDKVELPYDPDVVDGRMVQEAIAKTLDDDLLRLLIDRQGRFTSIPEKFAQSVVAENAAAYAHRYALGDEEALALSTFIVHGLVAASRTRGNRPQDAAWGEEDDVVSDFIRQGFSALTRHD